MNIIGNLQKKIIEKINLTRIKWIYEGEQNLCKCSKKLMPKQKFDEIKKFWKKYDSNYKGYEHIKYYTMSGEVNKLYIPDSYFYRFVDYYYNNWVKLKILDNKCFYKFYFNNVKQPETIAMKVDNFWYLNDKIITLDDLKNELVKEKEFVVKISCESTGGHGVKFYSEINKDFEEFERTHRDLIIQKVLKQSPIMAKLNNSSINTVRVMTFKNEQGIKCLSTIVRFGEEGHKVDNACSGGLVVGVEPDGRLKEDIYKPKIYKKVETKPNNVNYHEIIVPKFQDILNKAIELHSKINFSRIISWDFAIDENDDIVLIEANFFYGELFFHQLCNGPLFKTEDELLSVLNEVNKGK